MLEEDGEKCFVAGTNENRIKYDEKSGGRITIVFLVKMDPPGLAERLIDRT